MQNSKLLLRSYDIKFKKQLNDLSVKQSAMLLRDFLINVVLK